MEEKIREAFEAVKPDDEARAAMLQRLLEAAEEPPAPVPEEPRGKKRVLLRWALPLAAAAMAAVVLLPRLNPPAPDFHEEPPAAEETSPVPDRTEAETAPAKEPPARQETPPVILNGPMQAADTPPEEKPIRSGRPTVGLTAPAPAPRELAFEGGVYTPLSGETVEKDRLGEPLGMVSEDQPFREGSTVCALSGTDPAFRLAVEQEDGWVLLQRKVEKLADWLRAAGTVEGVSVTDPGERVVLQELTAEQMEKLLALLEESTETSLTETDRQAVEQTRQERAALRLQFRLREPPAFSMELLPRLGLVALDETYYTLPAAFESEFGSFFDALTGGSPQK